jgi:UDP-N-acetylglucosamine 1-carboxyvinyltransferase
MSAERTIDGAVHLETFDRSRCRASHTLVRRMRASFCVLGPLVARRGRGVVALPGGCAIGERPVDLHLRGLAALGAELSVWQGYVFARAARLRGATIDLAGPRGPTVTGTANVLCAATLARGRTIITSAATEPEVVDLGRFLGTLGARIDGLGTSTIEITGVEQLSGGSYRIVPDRIETATLLLAGAITRGRVCVRNCVPEHCTAVVAALREAGADVTATPDSLTVEVRRPFRPTLLTTGPYPGFPTDVQAQWLALVATIAGRSRLRDPIFPERFAHLAELRRLGAGCGLDADGAWVDGGPAMSGAAVDACDLRASAALVLAGLAAEGETHVRRLRHLDRGYEQLEAKLRALGADIERVERARPVRSAGRLQLVPR